MVINFISSKDSDQIRTMHTKSNNIEIMMGSETDEIIEELFESLLHKYQEGLEEKLRGSEFVFHSVDLLYYKIHKISLNRGGWYIDSPKWLKNKKAKINPKNTDNKCFQYALTVALNIKTLKMTLKEYQKLSLFFIYIVWKIQIFHHIKKDWKKFKLNNKSIALNICLYLIILKK